MGHIKATKLHGLGEFVFYRTYSRLKPNGSKESFLEVVKRVVEGKRKPEYNMVTWFLAYVQVYRNGAFQFGNRVYQGEEHPLAMVDRWNNNARDKKDEFQVVILSFQELKEYPAGFIGNFTDIDNLTHPIK